MPRLASSLAVCFAASSLLILAGCSSDPMAQPSNTSSAANTSAPVQHAPASPVLDRTMTSLSGQPVNLASKYKGKVVLIVNTASKCGFTPQYAGLEKIYKKYQADGFVILGFPCNQFHHQAPGDSAYIQQFCTENYGVTFPMFSKIKVNGPQATPLYQYLTSAQLPLPAADQGPVKWNFEKFLINRQGQVVARFRSKIKPTSSQVVDAIQQQLAQNG